MRPKWTNEGRCYVYVRLLKLSAEHFTIQTERNRLIIFGIKR
ncbi:MAG: hypothetical protein ACTS4U_01430 [Candidatus Hodgkinia cicadicola]